jgi:hypothetical protein
LPLDWPLSPKTRLLACRQCVVVLERLGGKVERKVSLWRKSTFWENL